MADIGVWALLPAGFCSSLPQSDIYCLYLKSRESDTRAVCGSEGFESPPTHKGPQRSAFIVIKLVKNTLYANLRAICEARSDWVVRFDRLAIRNAKWQIV